MTTAQLAMFTVTAAGLIVAFFLYFKGAADDGPIRVKGGSVIVEAPQDWVSPSAQHYRLAANNSALRQASVTVTLDGIAKAPAHGKVVQIDLVDPGDSSPDAGKVTIAIAGGIEVVNPRLTMSGRTLRSTGDGTYMTLVRVLGGGTPETFGPYSAAESKKLVIVIKPMK